MSVIVGSRHVVIPATGLRVSAPRSAAPAGPVWATWFDHCWVAKGAADLAASYVDLVGTSNLTTAAAPTFDAATGWTFNGSTQYLDTGVLVDAGDAGIWSYMVQFSDSGITELYNANVFGAYNVLVRPTWGGAFEVNASNGGAQTRIAPHLVTGNYCLAGLTAYRNGAFDTLLGGGVQWARNMYIGCGNIDGTPSGFFTGKIQAFGIKHGILTAGEVATVSAAMAAL